MALPAPNSALPAQRQEVPPQYDACIIGGGLAGLSLSILLAKQGWSVALFEKHRYPFHRVCGEYISLEAKPFLERLGLVISEAEHPHIHRLQVTAASGVQVNRPLDLGGFGISRYELDHRLSLIAIDAGVAILYERVEDVQVADNRFCVKTNKTSYSCHVSVGSFGKRSNLDIKFKRPFIQSKKKGLNNYLGIKYHIRYNHPKDLIALHNFRNGYCGISAIEDDKYCLCYLTAANNLSDNGNDIATMEKNVLYKNKQLQQIFSNAEFLYNEPLVISQISFAGKTQHVAGIPLCGDAAGLITPLCGNGMSMALKASCLLAPLLDDFLNGEKNIGDLNKEYSRLWKRTFNRRLQLGRFVQSSFGNNLLTSAFLTTCRVLPPLADALIRNSHGETF